MKLNKSCPLFRYEIARFLEMSEKQLYRFLKKKKVDIPSGMVMPCDLERIEALVFGEKVESIKDIQEGNIPHNS